MYRPLDQYSIHICTCYLTPSLVLVASECRSNGQKLFALSPVFTAYSRYDISYYIVSTITSARETLSYIEQDVRQNLVYRVSSVNAISNDKNESSRVESGLSQKKSYALYVREARMCPKV